MAAIGAKLRGFSLSIMLLLIGSGFLYSQGLDARAAACGPGLSLQDAVMSHCVGAVGSPLAKSDTANKVFALNLMQYPTTVGSSNFPQRGTGACTRTFPSNSSRKTLHMVPLIPGSTIYEGRDRKASGDCSTIGPWAGTIPDTRFVKAALDAGTNTRASWARADGSWINTTWMGGWARPLAGYDASWAAATEVDDPSSKTPAAIAACGGDADLVAGSIWLEKDGGTPITMNGDPRPIWSSTCKDMRDWGYDVYHANKYDDTIARNISANLGQLHYAGTTLFRRHMTIDAAMMGQITSAESRSGGLGIDIRADDFYAVYVNGQVINAQTQGPYTGVSIDRYIRIPSSYLNIGDNVIALQVDDKITFGMAPGSVGIGLRYSVSLYDDNASRWNTNGATTLESAAVIVPGSDAKWKHVIASDSTSRAPVDQPIQWEVWQKVNGGAEVRVSSGTAPAGAAPGAVVTSQSTVYPTSVADSGKTICQRIAWRPKQDGAPGSTGSTVSLCVRVATIPFAQVWGNDLRVGSGAAVNTASIVGAVVRSPSGASSQYFGSWGEYGVYAPSAVTNLASGAGLVNAITSNQAAWSNLTFANVAPNFGNFAPAVSLGAPPDIPTYFKLGSFPGVTKELITGGIAISSFRNQTVIIATGTVEITDSLTAPTGVAASEGAIPQMVIIARNINIHSNVTRLDAWLISSQGTINTCSDVPGNLTTAICNQQLEVTGPVIAKSLLMRRTYATPSGEPAEKINLRSDSYLWAHNLSTTQGSWRTRYVTELPPRY